MSNLRFPDASVIKNSRFVKNITAEKLARIQDNNIQLFESQYKDNLYCPECNQVKLFLRNGTEKIPHFSQSKNSFHKDDCSLNYKSISANQLKVIYEDKNPDNYEIHNRLNKIIGLFFQNKNVGSSPLVISVPKKKKPTTSTSVVGEETYVKASIPRRLVTALRTEDLRKIKIFYGDVYIKWNKAKNNTDNKSRWYLRIYKDYDKKNSKYKYLCCSIAISDRVYKYLKENKANYLDNQHCYIAFFTEICQKESNGNYYNNCSLRHSDFLEIKTIRII